MWSLSHSKEPTIWCQCSKNCQRQAPDQAKIRLEQLIGRLAAQFWQSVFTAKAYFFSEPCLIFAYTLLTKTLRPLLHYQNPKSYISKPLPLQNSELPTTFACAFASVFPLARSTPTGHLLHSKIGRYQPITTTFALVLFSLLLFGYRFLCSLFFCFNQHSSFNTLFVNLCYYYYTLLVVLTSIVHLFVYLFVTICLTPKYNTFFYLFALFVSFFSGSLTSIFQ